MGHVAPAVPTRHAQQRYQIGRRRGRKPPATRRTAPPRSCSSASGYPPRAPRQGASWAPSIAASPATEQEGCFIDLWGGGDPCALDSSRRPVDRGRRGHPRARGRHQHQARGHHTCVSSSETLSRLIRLFLFGLHLHSR